MKLFTFAVTSLRHYWRTQLGVLLATALCAAVLTGALLTNTSVRETLGAIGSRQLGSIEFALSSADRMFTESSASALQEKLERETAGLLRFRGGVSERTNGKYADAHILGVDSTFFSLSPSGRVLPPPDAGDVYLGRKLADSLAADVGDELIFRIHVPDAMPVDAPLAGSGAPSSIVRARVSQLIDDADFGVFGLEKSQILGKNAFFDRRDLSRMLGLDDGINTLLIRTGEDSDLTAGEVNAVFRSVFTIADAGLFVRKIPGETEILSTRVFIDPPIEKQALNRGARPVLTYFVDRISTGMSEGKEGIIPYSFVSAIDDEIMTGGLGDDQIALNRWAADDLGVEPGDVIYLDYRVLAPGSKLVNSSMPFTLKKIIEIDDRQKFLMPEYPGIHGSENCADWDPGFDIDLTVIRDRDEEYWDTYGGSPKAFITYSAGAAMWENRYGKSTALRLESPMELADSIDPRTLGFNFSAVGIEHEAAAAEGVDFTWLFLGLSLFLVASAVLLTALFFSLSFRQRREELGVLSAAGWPGGRIATAFLIEHSILALIGGAAGSVLGIVYNRLLLLGLETIWNDAVRLEEITQRITFSAVASGVLTSTAAAFLVFFFGVRRAQKLPVVRLLSPEPSGGRDTAEKAKRRIRGAPVAGWTGLGLAVVLTAVGMLGESSYRVISFFVSGMILLFSGMALFYAWMDSRGNRPGGELTIVRLGVLIGARRKLKSLNVAVLFAVGVFIVTAVGANRSGIPADPTERVSGTGGFLLIGESLAPVKNMPADVDMIGFKIVDGDDASCLNLTRAATPRLLGVDSGELTGRFSFSSSNHDKGEDPWSMLGADFADGYVPAIADQTVLTWGLGLEVGDTLTYRAERGEEMNLRIVAGLENSIFQGNIIVAEDRLSDYFPSASGKRFFLVDGSVDDQVNYGEELARRMGPYGLSLVPAADRLAEYSSVQNTYLAIFTILGGLGILLAALGLGIAAARSIFESRGEYGLLIAGGYKIGEVRKVIVIEHLVSLCAGAGIGFISAIVAVLPTAFANGTIQLGFISAAAVVITLCGFGSILLFTIRLSSRPLVNALRGE